MGDSIKKEQSGQEIKSPRCVRGVFVPVQEVLEGLPPLGVLLVHLFRIGTDGGFMRSNEEDEPAFLEIWLIYDFEREMPFLVWLRARADSYPDPRGFVLAGKGRERSVDGDERWTEKPSRHQEQNLADAAYVRLMVDFGEKLSRLFFARYAWSKESPSVAQKLSRSINADVLLNEHRKFVELRLGSLAGANMK